MISEKNAAESQHTTKPPFFGFFFSIPKAQQQYHGASQRAHAGPAQQDSRRRDRAHQVVSRMGTPRWDTCGALLVSRVCYLVCSRATSPHFGATLLLLCIGGLAGRCNGLKPAQQLYADTQHGYGPRGGRPLTEWRAV